MRQPCQAASSRHQLHITGSHTAGEPEDKKDNKADQPSHCCRAKLGPSTKEQMHQQSTADSRKSQEIGYPTTPYVEHRTRESADTRRGRVHQLVSLIHHFEIPKANRPP